MKKIFLAILLFAVLFTLPTGGVSAQALDSSEFVSETIPDNTQFLPGTSFTKTWTLRNNGGTTWTTAYSFVLIEGNAMGSTTVYLYKEVKPGETIDISITMTAPQFGDAITNRYQLKNANGTLFGARPYVLIKVGAQLVPTPGPTSIPAVGGPQTVIVTLSNGVTFTATEAPGNIYGPIGTLTPVKVTQYTCSLVLGFYKWCRNVDVPFSLPVAPSVTEPNVSANMGGTLYQGTFFGLAAGLTFASASQGVATGTFIVVESAAPIASGGLTIAQAAALAPAAAGAITGILVCGAVVLIYYANEVAMSYSGPAITTSSDTGSFDLETARFTAAVESLATTTLTTGQLVSQIDSIFTPGYFKSDEHPESAGVIAAMYNMAQGRTLKQRGSQCNYNCNGSIQLWGGVNTDGTGSVAIVYVASTKVAFLVLKGKLLNAGSGNIIPDNMIKLGAGQYIDPSKSIWAAAFILTKGIKKVYNPMDAVEVGEGMMLWQHKQAQYGLYIPLAQITLP